MTVLHITRDLAPHSRGGLSTAVSALVDLASEGGIEQYVLSFDDWRPRRGSSGSAPTAIEPNTRNSGAQVMRVTAQTSLNGALDWAQKQQPAVIHLHDPMLWESAEILSERCGASVVYTVHVAHWMSQKIRGTEELTYSQQAEIHALRLARTIHAPTRCVLDALHEDFPHLANKPSVVIPFVLEPTALTEKARKEQQCRPPSYDVLYVGRFSDIKGTADGLKAMSHVLSKIPQARLNVVGGSPGNNKGARRWWRKAVQSLDCVPSIQWEGWLEGEPLSEQYAQADVVILPSHFETFGLVATEAALHGAPLCTSDCPAFLERLTHNESALMSPVGDAEALASDVLRLLNDRALAQKLAASAYEMVVGRLNWRATRPLWESLWSQK